VEARGAVKAELKQHKRGSEARQQDALLEVAGEDQQGQHRQQHELRDMGPTLATARWLCVVALSDLRHQSPGRFATFPGVQEFLQPLLKTSVRSRPQPMPKPASTTGGQYQPSFLALPTFLLAH